MIKKPEYKQAIVVEIINIGNKYLYKNHKCKLNNTIKNPPNLFRKNLCVGLGICYIYDNTD